MSLPLPPASNLHAILLVTKSRSLGPRLVFHYPPSSPSAASLAANSVPSWYGNGASTGTDDSASSSDWESSTENEGDDEIGSRASGRGSGRTVISHRDREKSRASAGGAWSRQDTIEDDDPGLLGEPAHGDASRKGSAHGKDDRDGTPDWETVLGFKVDALEKMLCPSKSFNKRRFELGVENIVFVGAPMFVRDDGGWKKGRRWEMEKEKTTPEEQQHEQEILASLRIVGEDEGFDLPEQEPEERFVYPEGFEPGYGHGLMSGAASEAVSDAGSDTQSSTNGIKAGPDMTMFNVVFVLNPPALEYQLRVKEMYDNVVRKYAKALKYEQARFNYVWKETKRILHMKQRAKENGDPMSITWHEIINSSLLAKSIAIMFDAISNDKIAHIHFDATFDTSFQIPQAVSTPYLPTALEPQMPGLWLTTANVVNEEEENDAPLTQHSALLLLEDTETLVKELEGDSKDMNTPLAFYIRNITPTKSLQKISIKNSIPAQDIEYIAGHLVYWRRARLIPPLHPRDTYIVSPNADVSALKAAIPAFATRFPTLPSLPKILSLLSGTPRPYRMFIPTNDHREAYMEILAWLMRGGWVTQLRTFAWVRVTADIKAEVAAEMEREAAMKKAEEEPSRHFEDTESISSILSGSEYNKRSSFLSTNGPSTPLRHTSTEAIEPSTSTILSPRLTPHRSPSRPSSDAGSTGSNQTTVHQPSRDHRSHRPSPLHVKQSPSPSSSRSPTAYHDITSPLFPQSPSSDTPASNSNPLSPAQFKPSLIISPQKANALEARWLEKIGKSFPDKDLKDMWPVLLKYFDGKHALDDIAVREGLKRKRVAALLSGVREGGWLVTVRHW